MNQPTSEWLVLKCPSMAGFDLPGDKPLRLAVDTNVLLDLADGVEAILDAFAVLDQRLPASDTLVVPSVLDELAFLCDSADTARVRQS